MLALPILVFSLEEIEDATTVGCLPKRTHIEPISVCATCHQRQEAEQYFNKRQSSPCTPYCMTCHKSTAMSRHHSVGERLTKMPDEPLLLAAEMKMACFTCHNLTRPRYDSERWKAASLFDRVFRKQKRYKTYFLTLHNEQGQLCLTCH
jgi:hypothetical protein